MNDKILAAAKKAARRMARATGTSYQTCLDTVAQQAGRAHWSAFLADPVDVSVRQMHAASEGQTDAVHQEQMDVSKQPLRDVVIEEPNEETIAALLKDASFKSRVLRMLKGPERGIVKRSERRHVLSRRTERNPGGGLPLGRSIDNGYDLVLDETLPVLALAPPGAGKTAGVIVPAIISCDRHCLVIHDQAGLLEMTSGYRSSIGPVTLLDLAGNRSNGSLNPLSSSWLPADPASRSSYVAALAEAIGQGNRIAADIIGRTILGITGRSGSTTFAELYKTLSESDDVQVREAASHLSPYLDAAVRRCTTDDGFGPKHLRGVRDDNGEIRPSSLYIVRGAAGDERQGMVAATIQGAIWWWAMTVGPGMTSPDGDRHGWCPLTIILEDVHRLPLMPAMKGAIERSRAWKMSHLVTSFSYGSLSRAMNADVDEIEALFAVQIVLPQNDSSTITYLTNRLYGVTRQELASSRGSHVVALQYEAEPLKVRTPYFWLHPSTLSKVYNPRTGRGPRPTTM